MRKVKLSNCGDYILSPKISSNDLTCENFITTDNMLPNKAGIINAESVPQNLSVTQYIKNDILLSNIRPYFKKIWLAEYNGGCSADVLVFRTNNDYDSTYIKYCLSQDSFFAYDMAGSKGSKMPRGDKNHILNFELLDYDLQTQKNIGNLLLSIDKKIKLNNKINLELENFAKGLYEYWFVQFDFPDEFGRPYKSSGGEMVYSNELKREIPYGWSVNNIKSCITHINTGLNPRDNFILNNGNIKYITVKNLTTHGSIDFSNCDTIDDVAQKIVHKRSDISTGDILFASIAPLGRCYLIQEEPLNWDINESVFSIRPKKTIPSEYLYMFLMSETFVKKAENSSTGSVFAGIRIKTLEDMLLVIPENNILQEFKDKISKILLQKHIKECENQKLIQLRDFLLPMLMNGQISIIAE